MKLFALVFILSRISQGAMEAPSQNLIVNQILFSESAQSWTDRDFKLYKKIVLRISKNEKLSELSNDVFEDFLISRLLKREALLFEIQPEKIEFSHQSRSGDLAEFSNKEITDEVASISYSLALLNLKEKQMSQKARFKAWIDVLKRKYAVKIKTNEIRK